MHHKAYFEKCLTSSLIVQENPKKFKEFLAVQDLRSFPTLMNSIDNLATPESQHFEFDTRLTLPRQSTTQRMTSAVIVQLTCHDI